MNNPRIVTILREYNFSTEVEAYLEIPATMDLDGEWNNWMQLGAEAGTGKNFGDYLLGLVDVQRYDMEVVMY